MYVFLSLCLLTMKGIFLCKQAAEERRELGGTVMQGLEICDSKKGLGLNLLSLL